jgi:hypothetical protein
VLTSPAFVVAVALLLLNDWVLKLAIGNWLTGKLSDFAGLAAFSMFWAALLPERRRAVFVVTGIAFVLWKMPLTDATLQLWNAVGVWPLARVKDFSDLVALVVLVPAYRLLRRMDEPRSQPSDRLPRRARALVTGVAAIASFTATSIVRPMPIDWSGYTMPATRDLVLAGLDSNHVSISRRKNHPGPGGADTLVVDFRHPPERWVTMTVEVTDAGAGQTELRPIALLSHGPETATEGIRRAFVTQVVQPLQERLARRGGNAR